MKPTHLLCLALIVGGLATGCATAKNSAVTPADSPNLDPIITSLGSGFSIAVTANSWSALTNQTRPNFTWNDRDLMWIETDDHGQPRFILDEAYLYQPTNQPRQLVLLQEGSRKASNDSGTESPRFFYSNQNFHAVATLHEHLPPLLDDTGARGDYAIVLNTAQQFGTVYEIGWQSETSASTGHASHGRRIYVLHDHDNHWQFLGEGPREGAESDSSDTLKSGVIWQNSSTNPPPPKILF